MTKHNRRHYSTKDHEKKIFCALAILIIAIFVILWLAIDEMSRVKPDVEYPMTDTKITWTGAGYSGVWKGAGI